MNYTVQGGDTLGAIARRHGTNVEALQRLNGLADPNHIRVGQSLRLPHVAPVSSASLQTGQAAEPWAETVLRFVDALGRPIVGLMVRAVAEGREMLSTTGADGCIGPLTCDHPDGSIAVHVRRAAHKGSGEKHIGDIKPSPGKQSIKVQSGKHVATTKIRRHEGAPQRPPTQLKSLARGDKIETATLQGHPLVCVKGCECPNEDDLLLGANLEFKSWIKAAGQRAGIVTQAVAAVMNAEAVKLKDGKWNARSQSSKSSATGMTQFLDASWIGEAVREGTYLHDKAVKEGWLSRDGKGAWRFTKADGTTLSGPGLDTKLVKLLTDKRKASDPNLQKLLDLRFEAEFAIMAAMDYAKFNLDALRNKGYAINDLNDTEKARIMYLCHHLGLADAVHFIQNTIPSEDVTGVNKKGKTVVKQNGAKKLLTTQVGVDGTTKWLKKASNDWVKAHRYWLEDFEGRHIVPSVFTCPGEKLKQFGVEERLGDLQNITEALKK